MWRVYTTLLEQVLMQVSRSSLVQAALSLLCMCLCLVGHSHVASAQPSEVIILPMTTTSKALNIYRNAVPAALARRLIAVGIHAQAMSSTSSTPKSTKVIIDGRLISHHRDRVQIEVRIRRASTGRLVATLASDTTKNTDIETLVANLAARLAPTVNRALVPKSFQLPTTVVRADAPERQPDTKEQPMPDVTSTALPSVLLLPAAGEAAEGMIDVREPATEAAHAMVRRLGIAVAESTRHKGIANPLDVVVEMRERASNYSLMVHVMAVRFSYSSVLSAKGHVRVRLLGADGVAVFDRSVRTQTLVGARGDRHQALVYLVTEQALDMLLPEFRRALHGKEGV